MSGGVTQGATPHPPSDAAAGDVGPEPAGGSLATVAPGAPEPEGDPGPTDAELLHAHVEGDHSAFSTLVARHQDRLWAVALRVMGTPDDAADALQDAYVAAFRRAGTFRGEAQVTTWLHRVVVNACLDRLRRAKVRAVDPLPEDLDRVEVLGREPERDPVEERERHDAVAEALATLNPDQRAALVLVDVQGFSVEEAAAVLGCAPGTVKSRCARGRARLVPLLDHLRAPP
ncbi:RNA polymerase sigma factor SigM [Microlunatus sagamiharensis]|uniref:RNA polymerase sigma factor SigM n=1 Tax=Microlunatus sagamiharensis TaxID=546874 RepID=UPI001E465951|nr:RNA polymerase sigma factor SigM [Microlunatus sagamiharensis]